MQLVKNKEKIGNVLFYIGIALELLIMMTDQTGFSLDFRGRVAQVAFILFGCKILTTVYSKKEWVLIILAAVLGIVSYFTCEDEYVLRVVVMVIAAKNIDLQKILKLIFITVFVVTLSMMLLSILGIHGELYDIRDFGRGGVECRWKFGFNHANNVHDNLWYLTACYLLIRMKKTKWFEYGVLTVVNFLLFAFTRSKNGFLATLILLFACVLFQHLPKLEKRVWPYILAMISLFTCILVTIRAASYFIWDKFSILLDNLLTGRMEMVWEFAPLAKWKLFPESRELEYVDNGFASLFYLYGIVVGSIFIICLLYLIYSCYKQNNGFVLSILVTTIFIIFMERTFVWNASLLNNLLWVILIGWDGIGPEDGNKSIRDGELTEGS